MKALVNATFGCVSGLDVTVKPSWNFYFVGVVSADSYSRSQPFIKIFCICVNGRVTTSTRVLVNPLSFTNN